ncbi:MAG: hypothetical protein HYV09_24625 [Deltaproteobacteria bacterium]|nr:hypothetical protein [Deltaproteobacteria bacterium]
MARRKIIGLMGAGVVLFAASPSRAQAIQRVFDPQLNGPWTVIPFGSTEKLSESWELKALKVGPDGGVYIMGKVPIGGPPTGGGIFRVRDGKAELIGGKLVDDPHAFGVDESGKAYVGTKGITRPNAFHVLDGDGWRKLLDAPAGGEPGAILPDAGGLLLATKNDGIFRFDGTKAVRVGAKTTVLPDGFSWTTIGDWTVELERVARLPDGGFVGIGKDMRVRRWNGSAWSDLGDLCGPKFDETGALLSYVREPKAIGVAADGTIFVGTKGMTGPEGKDVGLLFRWDGAAWAQVGTPPVMRKEVKAIAFVGGSILAGTTESGVFRWDGAAWSAVNDGLVKTTDGKTKGERLSLEPDGALYLASANTVMRREATFGGTETWKEIGFFSGGEEIKAVAAKADGTVYAGAKVGTSKGAVFVRAPGATEFKVLGPDLPRDVDRVVIGADGTVFVVLGGGGGAYRFGSGAWEPITGALTGSLAAFKDLLPLEGGEFLAPTKAGVVRGVYRKEPIETVDFATKNCEVKALDRIGSHTIATCKVGGVFRLAKAEGTDDGFGWVKTTKGLPEVEAETTTAIGDDVFVVAKKLLYRGRFDGEGLLSVDAFGPNPGKASLGGDGQLVFAGETGFKAIARLPDGRFVVGTDDGLFVTGASGGTWALFNGPAEVKGVAVVGRFLYATVKEKRYPKPVDDPTLVIESSSLWIRDLDAAPIPEPPAKPVDAAKEDTDVGGGCAVSTRTAAASSWMLLGLAATAALLRRRRA